MQTEAYGYIKEIDRRSGPQGQVQNEMGRSGGWSLQV